MIRTSGDKKNRVDGYISLVLNDTLHTLFSHWSTKMMCFIQRHVCFLLHPRSFSFNLFRFRFVLFVVFPILYLSIYLLLVSLHRLPTFRLQLVLFLTQSFPFYLLLLFFFFLFNALAFFYAFVSTLLRFIFGTCCMSLKIGIESTNFWWICRFASRNWIVIICVAEEKLNFTRKSVRYAIAVWVNVTTYTSILYAGDSVRFGSVRFRVKWTIFVMHIYGTVNRPCIL